MPILKAKLNKFYHNSMQKNEKKDIELKYNIIT